MTGNIMVDEKDYKILEELKKNSRQTTTELSKKLDIPRTTIHYRIKKMKDEGLIKKFTVIPNYDQLDKGTTAYILVSFDPNEGVTQRETASKISQMDRVHELHIISGEWDIMVKVRGKTAEEIGDIVVDQLREIDGVGHSTTCVSFESVKEEI